MGGRTEVCAWFDGETISKKVGAWEPKRGTGHDSPPKTASQPKPARASVRRFLLSSQSISLSLSLRQGELPILHYSPEISSSSSNHAIPSPHSIKGVEISLSSFCLSPLSSLCLTRLFLRIISSIIIVIPIKGLVHPNENNLLLKSRASDFGRRHYYMPDRLKRILRSGNITAIISPLLNPQPIFHVTTLCLPRPRILRGCGISV